MDCDVPSPEATMNHAHAFTALALTAAGTAHADSGVSAGAPDIVFYAGIGEDCCGEDPHPVHGIATPDGGFAVCGKAIDESGEWEGFVVKVGPDVPEGFSFLEQGEAYQYEWSATFGSDGLPDGANNVFATDEALFVVGFVSADDGSLDRNMRKYDLFSGALIWETAFPDPTGGMDGALEAIYPTGSGDVIVGGFVNGEPGAVEGFKSYGNAVSGEATAMYFSADQLSASTAPDAPQWSTFHPDSVSIKSIRPIGTEGYAFIASDQDEESSITRLDSQGQAVWTRSIREHGEATDLAMFSTDGAPVGIAVAGHRGVDGGIDGSVTLLDLDGEEVWSKNYGNPPGGVNEFAGLDGGNPALIFDECWGIQATASGGAVVACGTGIEGCGEVDEGTALHAECMADPRRVWRGLVFEVDSSGDVLWHRIDSFNLPGEEGDVGDSASEYVALTPGGNVVSVVDQGFGIGLMLLGDASLDAPQGCACQTQRSPSSSAWLCLAFLALLGLSRRAA
jgi:hypothetical protein